MYLPSQGVGDYDHYDFTLPSQSQTTQSLQSQLTQSDPGNWTSLSPSSSQLLSSLSLSLSSDKQRASAELSSLAGLTLHGDDSEEEDQGPQELPEYACR